MTYKIFKKIGIVAGMLVVLGFVAPQDVAAQAIGLDAYDDFVSEVVEKRLQDDGNPYHEVEISGQLYLVPKVLGTSTAPALRGAIQREAQIRGIGSGFWSGCNFYLTGPSGGGMTRINVNTVRAIVQSDKCVNIDGVQANIPSGFRDVGGKICQLTNDFHILCRAGVNPVRPGDNVTFIASPINHQSGSIQYQWNNTSNGTSLGNTSSRDSSFIETSFANQGIHQVTVRATDPGGNIAQRVCGVTVANNLDAVGVDLDGDGAADTGAAAPQVTLEATGGLLTNSTCPVRWEATNVDECYLAKGSGTTQQINFTGTADVLPGSYQVRCVSYKVGFTTVESDTLVCRENVDVREI